MKTSLHNSPFAQLGVSTRDKVAKIVEQAEEKSLFLDSEVCTKARNDLSTNRNRLATEMCWLPGVSPSRANGLLEALTKDIETLKDDSSLPPLANANLLAAVFEILDPEIAASEWRDWIVHFAYTADQIEPEDILREINADRTLSGFPEIKGTEQIEAELCERRSYYTEVIKSALNKLPSMKLVNVITDVVEYCTDSGDDHAPQLIHELVNRYETEANRYLDPEAENIKKLIEAIQSSAGKGEAAIKLQIDKLEQVARKWDAIAQPIQLSMKSQGLDHKLSHDVARGIRSLAIDLFNEHDMVSTVTRLTKMLQELFAELPAMAEKLEEDSVAISDILRVRQNAERLKVEKAKEINYETEVGLVFKDILKISSDGVEWKGRKIELETISKVRWGSVRRSVNGVPTGTYYTIAVGGDNTSEIVIETMKEEIFKRFTDCLWKAVCVRLFEQYLIELKNSQQVSIGGVIIDDEGIFLTKHKLFQNETLYIAWGAVTYLSHNGILEISAAHEKNTYVKLSYLSAPNTHILEAIIRISFKKWNGKLSGILDN